MTRMLRAALVAATVTTGLSGARAQDAGAQYKALLDKQAPAIVTVNVVLKMSMKGESESMEQRMSLRGVVVSPDGLVMLTNMPFSSKRLSQMLGGDESDVEGLKMTPTSLKVVVEREEKEYSAFMAATDTVLDLAFIKMEGLADRKLTAIDFSGAADPAVGQEVVGVTRLSKGYDYAPTFAVGRICGEIAKPRHAWALNGASELGLPVFNAGGQVLGVLSIVPPSSRDGDAAASFAMAMRMLAGSGGMAQLFLVPGQTVKAVIDQAAKRAADLAVERAKNPPAPEKATPAKPAPKKPTAPK